MSLWTIAWLIWGAAFAVIEGAALLRSRSGSLSETVWGWAGVRSGLWTWKRWVLLGGLVWLLLHLAFGWLSL